MAILFNIKHESLANGTIESDSPITEGEDLNVTVMVDENTVDFDIDWDGLVPAGTYPNYIIFSPPAGDYTFTLTVEDAFGRTKDITEDVSVVAPSWVSKFDNTFWIPITGTWTGSQYESNFGSINLIVNGDWYSGYRPTKMRITTNVQIDSVELWDSVSPLVIEADYDSLSELVLSFGNDIDNLVLSDAPEFVVTNIEFLE